ncbi:MAG: glucosaminidase domain-containing protein [Acidobacteria bacterium]|nr:glucosaminidase domain-containing protein [Acidobacteriota bacterium]
MTRLQRFFHRYNCPVGRLAPSFIRASDRHRIDWRLLPSLALVESGCGKESFRNNIFGWGNGTIPFRSIEQGIHRVAERLANSEYYRGKSLEEVLVTYNPVPGYVARVQNVMRELGPTPFAPVIVD